MPFSKYRHCDRSSSRWLVVLSLVLMCFGLSCRPASGQTVPASPGEASGGPPAAAAPDRAPYVTDPYEEGLKNDRNTVNKILRAEQFGAGQQDVFDRYYRRYVLARWSLPQNRASLTAFRKELRNNLKTAKRGAVHDHLNTLVLNYMSERAKRHYHPAVRVNAVLMIGELNAVEALRSSDVPVPLPEARQVLLQTIADQQQPGGAPAEEEVVKLAALAGILRHAQIGISDADARRSVGDAMLALANSKRSTGQSAVGYAWIRTRAAEVLGELKAVGSNGAVVKALVGIVADTELPFSSRCAAAGALGKLDYRGAAELSGSASQFATVLGQLALDATEAEAKAARVFARRLKYRIHAAFIGLSGADEEHTGGIASLATGQPHRTFVAELRRSMEAVLGLIDGKQEGDQLIRKVKTEATTLRNSLAPRAAAKPAETKKAG